ncbi:hypothetical protein [Microvirga massiliensis]|uniref:hypothetical protein n=1 Tax=Microvirga massiliensis TaxID=1033741 RepID=UPI00062B97E4|nr:hypothetical protein [Microvirga massiliensis]
MLDTKPLSQALAAIRSRLAEIDQQIAALEAERERLHKGKEGLSALLGETKPPPEPESAKRGPGRPRKTREPGAPPKPRANTFRSRLLAAIQQAPEGLPTPQIRDMFPDQKQSTLAGTLSNLRRNGLLRSEAGVWFPVERTEPLDAGPEVEETAPVPDAMASNEVDQDLLKAAP